MVTHVDVQTIEKLEGLKEEALKMTPFSELEYEQKKIVVDHLPCVIPEAWINVSHMVKDAI